MERLQAVRGSPDSSIPTEVWPVFEAGVVGGTTDHQDGACRVADMSARCRVEQRDQGDDPGHSPYVERGDRTRNVDWVNGGCGPGSKQGLKMILPLILLKVVSD